MDKENHKFPKEGTPTYLKYIGVAFQMLVTIGLGLWIGYFFDQKTSWDFPVWLLTGFVLSTSIVFYQLFKSISSDKNS